MVILPRNHAQRFTISNEVHARPPEPLEAPVAISYLALATDWPYADKDRDVVTELTRQFGATPPGPGAKHYSVQLGGFRLVWERHTEFTRYTFIKKADAEAPFATPAVGAVPEQWLAYLPGELIAAINAAVVPELPDGQSHQAMSQRFFDGNAVIGSEITGGAATAFTDFRIHADGFSRLLIQQKRAMSPWHAGRVAQRLLEIETYRLLALLALPVAQELTPSLVASAEELASITSNMTDAEEADEPALLERLTELQAGIERGIVASQDRFSAAAAYHALVQARITELREERIAGMQTFEEFTERRLSPAMNTCVAVSKRQQLLSVRVDRAAQLLSTRVDLSLERQNQAVLESMNRRAELQLRLQQTVEGLSVAAITYYTLGVIGYFAKSIEKAGWWGLDAETMTALAAPFVLFLVVFIVWRTRSHVERESTVTSDASLPASNRAVAATIAREEET